MARPVPPLEPTHRVWIEGSRYSTLEITVALEMTYEEVNITNSKEDILDTFLGCVDCEHFLINL